MHLVSFFIHSFTSLHSESSLHFPPESSLVSLSRPICTGVLGYSDQTRHSRSSLCAYSSILLRCGANTPTLQSHGSLLLCPFPPQALAFLPRFINPIGQLSSVYSFPDQFPFPSHYKWGSISLQHPGGVISQKMGASLEVQPSCWDS